MARLTSLNFTEFSFQLPQFKEMDIDILVMEDNEILCDRGVNNKVQSQ